MTFAWIDRHRQTWSVTLLCHCLDVSRAGEAPYLVMEYVEGETLQQVLDRDGAVPFGTAAEYVAQAAAGLQHAHEKGFVHRDIKPGNLIRDRSGTVKILDMGLARSGETRDRLTEQLDHGAVVGTADFIAPEQALRRPTDGRARAARLTWSRDPASPCRR